MTSPAWPDATGARVAVSSRAVRIVSLVPSITELLFDLGLDDAVAGVTRFCSEPRARVARKPRIGGPKDPDLDRILALRPDLVVANMEENHREAVERLRAEGLAVWVTFPRTARQAVALIREMGTLTGTERAAESLAAPIEARLRATVCRLAARRPVRVFCPIWREPWMTVGAETYVHDVLTVCGGAPVGAGPSGRYPTVTLEEVAALDPEVVLLPDEPYRFRDRHRAELDPLRGTRALRDGRVHLVDGKLITWYGARLDAALIRLPPLLAA